MDSPPVPDDLLLDIFLRIPDPADLVRVSAACVSFRGLVADRTFLRKYCKLHTAPLLGFLDRDQTFHPAVQPHPSAPAASAVALAVDFSFSFLPAISSRPTSYAYGCFYWVVGTRTKVTDCREMLLVLDTRKMEFSIVDAPPEAKGSYVGNITIVEAGEGRPGMFALAADRSYLNYIIMQNNSGCSSRWQFEKTISLDSKYFIMGSAGRYLLLYHSGSPSVDVCGFTLDVKTLKLERMFVSNSCIPYGRTYSNFPPSLLSTPTISSGVEERGEEVLEQGCAAGSRAESPGPSEYC
ncbi:unnamed protein product [Alopecurus aequalis]